MRKFKLPFTLVVTIITWLCAPAQDFSNKGKEFWLAYCYHVGMINPGGPPTMTLYITSDIATTYTVEIYGGPILQSGSITAGQVVTCIIPSAYYINNDGLFVNKAIHITAQKPVVVYSYITRSAASGATLCLPTSVLGREYYSANFTQASNEPNSNSYFTIVAVEDNTTVEIKPTANTKGGWSASTTYTINLNKGEIYQVLGTENGSTGVDLTGSYIRSVSSGSGGCKRIAVFSGSGKIRIPASCTQNSSDNLYQQLYPIASWGKKFLTIPSYNRPNNYYRIIRNTPTTNVYLNGSLINPALFTNNYYQLFNNAPNLIEASEPISVAQYFTTQGCDGNGSPYDPDMIVLNPVEQNINKVTLVSSNMVNAPPQHHIHVIMPNGGTGISSFRLDGNPISYSWVVDPAEPNYSYVYLSNVSQGYHTLSSDSGFNALAYGYANAETYGYSAGANVKDLYQFVSIQNQYATINFPAGCKNSPFYFSMTFPYQPTQIAWNFFGLFPNVTLNSPIYDSTWFVNGRQLYRYKLPTPYTISSSGTYPIQVLAQNPTSDGCSGEQQIDYDLQVFDPPVANFSFTSNGCLTDSVRFLGAANTGGRSVINHSWNFGDGGTASIQNPAHLYLSANSYTVKYSVITDVGCLSDTASQTFAVSNPPVAKFAASIPGCTSLPVTFTDQSDALGSTIVKWYWDFGDGSPQVIATNGNSQAHTYNAASTYTVTLKVEIASGCQSTLFSKQVIISAKPLANFSFTNACLPSGSTQFTDQSSVSAGNISQWSWNFGDGTTSTQRNPVHNYSSTGPFNVTLTVTTNNGCSDDSVKLMDKVYAQPLAAFSAPAEICNGSTINFTDQSTAANSTITQWSWDFGDGTASTQQNPTKVYANPNTYVVKLTVTSAIGCLSTIATKNIVVNPLPTANFNISAPDCINKNITFTDISVANAGNIVKWTWNFGDGNNSVLTSGIPFTHIYSATGTYNITLQVETNKGCVSTIFSKQVIISPLPVVNFVLPESCLDDPFSQFNDSSSIADGSQNLFTYQWNFGDQNANGSNPNTSALKNPQHRYTATGPYTVTETITSNNGCSSSITKTFFVNGSVPVPTFSIPGGTSICSGSVINLTDNSIVNPGNIVKIEIYWDYTNDPTLKMIDDNPSPGKVYSYTYSEFGSPVSKAVTIKYVAYSGQTCLQSIDKVITLLATPTVQFNAMQGVCQDVPAFQITEASAINGLPGTGTFSGPGVSATGLFNPAAASVGINTIRYTYNANNGCSNYKDQTIEVYPVPVANAGPDKFVLEGGITTLTPAVNASYPVTYLWTPATWLDNPESEAPKTSPLSDITYTLTVTSDKGCSSSDNVFVKILKAPLIPNIFSPNNDGIHDKWEISYLASYPGCTVDIYNRYGQLIYHSVGYDKPWDGTVNGKQVPVGTYYYIIDPKNGRQKMSGYVDVIR